MAQAAPKMTEGIPPSVSGGGIDRDHLARMTLGDRSLEREVLELFDRQASVLLGRLRTADAAAVAALAHTLKGSALGVGAIAVAEAAAAVEKAGDPVAMSPAIERLAVAIEATHAHIGALLRTASE